jgi:anaerobic selenocysteine-containing dehydrogenase
LLVHPSDAASRQLADGELARLGSDVGTIVVPVEISDRILPGVVSLPHGWGHQPNGTRLNVARGHAGASVNDVTSDLHLDTLSGNAAFNGLAVTLQRADATVSLQETRTSRGTSGVAHLPAIAPMAPTSTP